MKKSSHPLLYQVNTRVWLNQLSQEFGHPCTLDDLPDEWLEAIAQQGFDWIYFLGVWQTGAAGRIHSRTAPGMRQEFFTVLPDLENNDICGSCFAITRYSVAQNLGGNQAMQRLQERLHHFGMRLMLDFVPNHTATDHPWVISHPEYYMHGTPADLKEQPDNFIALLTPAGEKILAHGRDPYFSGWVDTLQLDYSQPIVQRIMQEELMNIASLCDGVRCDMAMLVLPEIFLRTWGLSCAPFWPDTIQRVHQAHPGFTLMAEVYWDMETTLLQQGFDFAYDKKLLDLLIHGQGKEVVAHLEKTSPNQDRLARFLENHDEKRAASVFPLEVHQAAAVITYLSPCLRFFHQGQLTGNRLRVPVHLCRGPQESPDITLMEFYANLIECLSMPAIRMGSCQMLKPEALGLSDNPGESLLGFAWKAFGTNPVLVLVNYSGAATTARLDLDDFKLSGDRIRLLDQMSPMIIEIDPSKSNNQKHTLDMPAWSLHVFSLEVT